MPIEVELPDGTIAEFPDGTSHAVIKAALSRQKSTAPAQQAEQPGVGGDMLKSFGTGVYKGMLGMAALPGNVETLGRMGINAAARTLGYEEPVASKSVLPSSQDYIEHMKPVTGDVYTPKTTAGQYAGTLGEFAPGAAFPGTMAQRILGNVAGPALASETAGQVTQGTALEPWARVAGGIAGGGAANALSRAYTPVPTSGPRQAAVQTLRNEGVTALSAGEVTGSKPLRYLEQHASDIPFSGGRAGTQAERAGEQFTAAVLRRAGMPGNRADQDAINAAFTQQGARFDQLAQASTARLLPADANRIQTAVQNYERMTPPSNQVPFMREIVADLATHAGNPIPGAVYQRYRSALEAGARQSTDPLASQAMRDIRNVLDDAVERGLPQAAQGQWRETRNHYRNLLVVAKASAAGGENAANGLISPAQLAIATKQIHGERNFQRGAGDYARLARAGQAVMSPLPNSGTPARLAAGAVGSAFGQAVGGMAGGAPGMGVGAFLGPIGTGLTARAFMSGPMQQYLGANARAAPVTVDGRMGAAAALPFSLPASGLLMGEDR